MSGNMPSGDPAVSVIMIFRDAGRFIDEAIRSVEAQTLVDWELVLVDDGSVDEGPAIVAGHQARLGDRLRLLRHPGGINRGIAESRNLGMRAARGRYLAFLDADDVYQPDRLQRHVSLLERDPALGVVISADLYWHNWSTAGTQVPGQADRIIVPAVAPGSRIEPPALILATLLTRGAPMPATCSFTFRRADIARLGGVPEQFTGHYEDQALICKLLLERPAVVLEEWLARYRQHADSLTRANSPLEQTPGSPAWAARRQFLEWLGSYAGSRGLVLPELQSWIRDELNLLATATNRAQSSTTASWRAVVLRAMDRALPTPVAASLLALLRNTPQGALRRRALRRVQYYERNRPAFKGAIRHYWNERIHDTTLSDDPVGTAGFYAALDAYRLQKLPYLPRLVNFGAWDGRDVLEIGCGAGLDLVRFASGGSRVTGIDVATTAIALARGYCDVAGVSAQLLEADGSCLPFADASFDLVYCSGVLPFAADPAAVVSEAHRVLRSGGEAHFMVYNRRSWLRFLERIAGPRAGHGHADAPGFRLYTAAEFDRLLEPFAQRRHVVERLPTATQRHSGIAGGVFNRIAVPLARALPDCWVRPYGGHLWVFCRKVR